MNRDVVLGQCLAMRSQLDALIAALVIEQEAEQVTCSHPRDDRRYLGGMGEVTGFKCLRCDTVVESREQPKQ